jgi:hypothetical protein
MEALRRFSRTCAGSCLGDQIREDRLDGPTIRAALLRDRRNGLLQANASFSVSTIMATVSRMSTAVVIQAVVCSHLGFR